MDDQQDSNKGEYKMVRAVDRALDILLCFAESKELSLTTIAKRVSLNKSTVFRILSTLEKKGFLARNPETEKYRLGLRMWELSVNLSHDDDPANLFLPEMTALRDTLGETVSLYIRDGRERVRIQAVESNQTIRRVAPIGARMPLSVGASSKALVTYASPDVQQLVFNDPNWPAWVSKEEYARQMEQIFANGYATSMEEREPGTSAIAAPIFNRRGKVIAALAVSGPASRLTLQRMKEFSPQIIAAAERMGKMVK